MVPAAGTIRTYWTIDLQYCYVTVIHQATMRSACRAACVPAPLPTGGTSPVDGGSPESSAFGYGDQDPCAVQMYPYDTARKHTAGRGACRRSRADIRMTRKRLYAAGNARPSRSRS